MPKHWEKKILTLNEMYSNVIIGIEYLITWVYEKLKEKLVSLMEHLIDLIFNVLISEIFNIKWNLRDWILSPFSDFIFKQNPNYRPITKDGFVFKSIFYKVENTVIQCNWLQRSSQIADDFLIWRLF